MSQEQQKVEEVQGSPEPVLINLAEVGPSETPGATESERNTAQSGQLVPVSEAIKYRKRAQVAEQQVEQLKREMSQRQQEQQDARKELEKMQQETELTGALVRAGVIDVEAASLLAQKKVESSENGQDVNSIIENLRRERPYLFMDGSESTVPWAEPTAGVRGQNNGRANVLARMAQQVRRSGSRKDMQEYLRLRRTLRG